MRRDALGRSGGRGEPAALSPSQTQALSQNVTRKVIVVMRNQFAGVSAAPASLPTRRADIEQAQQPVLSDLASSGSMDVTSYTTVDAVSATVSPGEESQLASNPAVAEVFPDALIPLSSPSRRTPAAAAVAVPPRSRARAPVRATSSLIHRRSRRSAPTQTFPDSPRLARSATRARE